MVPVGKASPANGGPASPELQDSSPDSHGQLWLCSSQAVLCLLPEAQSLTNLPVSKPD